MRLILSLFIEGLFLISCISHGQPAIHETLNERGDVIERWGNYHERDDEDDFREFLYYDKNHRLTEVKRFLFNSPNPDCIVTDTAMYMSNLYTYDDNGKLLDEKIDVNVTDDNDRVLSHTLGFHYDHQKGAESGILEKE